MELPKNITQIGETNPHCKIYVEDYVISYIKQLNQHAKDKELTAALYGVKKEEGGITYLFLYGACRLLFLQRECRHLSQAVQQEIEKQRRKYFPDYIFLGYRILNGEMVEGFHICEQSVCRYVEGYAQFYEKNDAMLAFMLEERQEEIQPETVDQEKYDVVRKRQEERRALAEDKRGQAFHFKVRERKQPASGAESGAGKMRNMKFAAAAVFALLCVTGLATMGNGERLEEWQTAARQLMENMSRKQLPDVVEVSNGSAQVGTIVAEDKLTDAIRQENTAAGEGSPESDSGQAANPANGEGAETTQQSGQQTEQPSGQPSGNGQAPPESAQTPDQQATPEPQPTPEPTPQPTPEPTPQPTPEPTPQPTPDQAAELTSYIVQRGDTLIGICIRKYGSDARVREICSLNNIDDPDDIKEGEKIFLPQ